MSELNKIKEKFILHWGEMGSLWGINRTMAQVHALLFISPEPLCANDIMAELQISRGNVSMALRELIAWGIVNRVHIKGERREFYTTEKDVWTLFRIIARERKKREVDPTIEVLRESVTKLNQMPDTDGNYEREQLKNLLDFFETGIEVYKDLEMQTPTSILKLMGKALRVKQLIS
ncbi:MAG: GbsR/MarR family transcriptional regulator [Anaerolineae bacterium]|nr:GbsR/MarR family transcriptional regulator [Anaerolineales bacterium]MCQ3975683.1 transcriptional regulator [Anaerolineae bacterium]